MPPPEATSLGILGRLQNCLINYDPEPPAPPFLGCRCITNRLQVVLDCREKERTTFGCLTCDAISTAVGFETSDSLCPLQFGLLPVSTSPAFGSRVIGLNCVSLPADPAGDALLESGDSSFLDKPSRKQGQALL